MASDSTEKKSAPPASPEPKKKASSRRLPFGAILSDVGLLLLEVILPVVLSAAALWFLFRNYNLFQTLDRNLALGIFVVALVVISLTLIVFLDTLTYPLRKPNRVQGVKFGSNATTRLVKMALGGVIIPIAIFIAASFILIPPSGTAIDYLIRNSQNIAPATPPEQIATLVIKSTNINTKVLGIQALAGFRSPESLAQMVRILNEGAASLQDANVYAALSKAIASYGVTAKAPLLGAFNAVDPTLRAKSIGLNDELYTRYFSQSFDNLRAEVKLQNQGSDALASQLALVDAADAQLKQNLANVQAGTLKTAGKDLRLDFVLRTFLAMTITKDADLLTFAQTVAADTSYPSAVRGDAILLVAKLGTPDLESSLYPYMQSTDELLQASALQAITTLQTKPSK